jgi:hypothetical protein
MQSYLLLHQEAAAPGEQQLLRSSSRTIIQEYLVGSR